MVKRKIKIVFIVTFLFCLLTSLAVAEAGLQMSQEMVSLAKGKTQKIEAVVSDDTLEKAVKVIWESSDQSVVSVSNGTITARKEGNATITCTMQWKDGMELKGTTEVDVFLPVTQVNTDIRTLTLNVGSSQKITATVLPEGARYNTVTWTSSDENIAVVDENGIVTGMSVGKVKITATSNDPIDSKAQPKNVVCNVTVNQGAESIAIDAELATVFKGKNRKLIATVMPDTTTNKKVIWTSSDTAVATVDANGQVAGKGIGVCEISATTADGSEQVAICKVTVEQAVASVKVSTATLTLAKDATESLSAEVLPADATNTTVIWKSSDGSIASVDETGKITAKKTGKCDIIAEAADGSGKRAVCKLTVTPKYPVVIEKGTITMPYYRPEVSLSLKNIGQDSIAYVELSTYMYDGNGNKVSGKYGNRIDLTSDNVIGSKKTVKWYWNLPSGYSNVSQVMVAVAEYRLKGSNKKITIPEADREYVNVQMKGYSCVVPNVPNAAEIAKKYYSGDKAIYPATILGNTASFSSFAEMKDGELVRQLENKTLQGQLLWSMVLDFAMACSDTTTHQYKNGVSYYIGAKDKTVTAIICLESGGYDLLEYTFCENVIYQYNSSATDIMGLKKELMGTCDKIYELTPTELEETKQYVLSQFS